MQILINQLPKPKPYSTLFLDVDSFFASVEQFDDPHLRGRPIGVSTGDSKGASIIAASIEAKRMGVRGGCRVETARAMCPGLVLVRGHHHRYRDVHRQLMAILQATPCMVQAKSIDEAALKVPHYMQNEESVLALCKAIKASLYKKYNEHIRCSMGISSNIWLSKMASNSQKPNGLVLAQDNLDAFYGQHSLLALTGINYRMRRRFIGLGMYTPLDIYRASRLFLRKNLGVEGEKWYFRMRGYEVDEHQLVVQSTLSHQVTCVPDCPDTSDKVTTFLTKIAEVLGKRLRDKGLKARSVYLALLTESHGYMVAEYKNVAEFNDSHILSSHLDMLLKKLKIVEPIKKISVGVAKVTTSWQLDMETYLHNRRANTVYDAIDKLSLKYKQDQVRSLHLANSDFIDLERVGFAGDIMRETSDIANY